MVRSNRAPGRRGRVARAKSLRFWELLSSPSCYLRLPAYFFWWRHYQTTPAYSLAVLVDAAQRNDMATVDTIADMDKIVDNFAAQVTDKAAGRYGVALSGDMRKQIEALAPKLLPAIRQNVRDAVAARVKEITANSGHQPFIVLAVGLPYFVNVHCRRRRYAKATAVVQDQQVELELARAANGWKVVALRDDALGAASHRSGHQRSACDWSGQ